MSQPAEHNHKQNRGAPESTWEVVRRCLAIALRLQGGPATKAELLAVSRQSVPPHEKKTADTLSAASKRFDNDRQRLAELGFVLVYDRSRKLYALGEEGNRPLLNLSEAHLYTLAFLYNSYGHNAPHGYDVAQLIEQLVAWLPAERQRLFWQKQRLTLGHNVQLRDAERVDSGVRWQIQEAYERRQVVVFDYISRTNELGIPREHRVQPWEMRVNRRGHWELWGFCEWCDTGKDGVGWERRDYVAYRLNRIVPGSVRILPHKLPGVRPLGKPQEVVYQLHPHLVAGERPSTQAELIGEPTVAVLADGWVEVRGRTHDVFGLARSLLYYGGNCRVVGGKALLAEVRKVVGELARVYGGE